MRSFPPHEPAGLILLLLAGLSLAGCKAKPAGSPRVVAPSVPAPVAPSAPAPVAPLPRTVLSLDRSAYHATLHLDGDWIYVLTDDAIHAVVPGQPPRRWPVPLGHAVAATRAGFIYWNQGSLWQVPKPGGASRRLAKLPRAPQYLLAAGRRFAWIDRDDRGTYTVGELAGTRPRVAYTAAGSVGAAILGDDRVVYAEQDRPGSFRLVSVPLDGAPPTVGRSRRGRTPSMLAGFEGRVAYYDGQVFEARVLPADLRDEQVVGVDLICTPLALADRLYCGHVEGLSALSLADHTVTLLAPNRRTLITALAADPRRVVAILDAAGRLEVRLLTFR